MAKPYDIICRALKDIGALEAGETPTADAAQDAFDMLNDMLDQWSNEDMMTFRWTEIVFPVVQNQTQYTIGPSGSVYATFVGSITDDILTVTSATQGGITLNMTITGAGIPAGTESRSCRRTTESALPPSRSAFVSPTHTTAINPARWAASALARTSASFSL